MCIYIYIYIYVYIYIHTYVYIYALGCLKKKSRTYMSTIGVQHKDSWYSKD